MQVKIAESDLHLYVRLSLHHDYQAIDCTSVQLADSPVRDMKVNFTKDPA